jgi:hypothetical protein
MIYADFFLGLRVPTSRDFAKNAQRCHRCTDFLFPKVLFGNAPRFVIPADFRPESRARNALFLQVLIIVGREQKSGEQNLLNADYADWL